MNNKILYTLAFAVSLSACGDDSSIAIPPPEFVSSIDLLGDRTYPEGILALDNGDLLVTSFGDGSIQRIIDGQQVEYFSEPGANGVIGAVGLAVDTRRNRLWVANFNFDIGNGIPGGNLKVFNLQTGQLEATVPEQWVAGAFFNELAIRSDGTVYASDTLAPRVWMAPPDLSGVSVLIEDPILANPDPARAFGLNGLAITTNEEFLITSVMDRLDAGGGRLVRISIAQRNAQNIELQGEAVSNFAGSDGMIFHDSRLFMVNVFSAAGAIMTAQFNENFTTATINNSPASIQSFFNRPTAPAVRNGRLWVINSQLDHIVDDENGALGTPPQTPFQIVYFPLSLFP